MAWVGGDYTSKKILPFIIPFLGKFPIILDILSFQGFSFQGNPS